MNVMDKPQMPGRALVTGASAGIGREFARALAARDIDLILLARDRNRLSSLARELVSHFGVVVDVLPVDLAAPGATPAVFEALKAENVEVDILVNNAGVLIEGDFAEVPWVDQERELQLNIIALTALTRFFVEPMRRRRRGRILNVASTAAFLPLPRLATYSASKAYVLAFTEALGQELSGSGVTATAFCPGLTDTQMLRGSQVLAPFPSALVMSPAEVARRGVEACLAGETVAVPGLVNNALTSGARLMPRAWLRALGGAANVGQLGRLARVIADLRRLSGREDAG
jgi:short-subunit dehydrogenase